jgi:hypothetical protein
MVGYTKNIALQKLTSINHLDVAAIERGLTISTEEWLTQQPKSLRIRTVQSPTAPIAVRSRYVRELLR